MSDLNAHADLTFGLNDQQFVDGANKIVSSSDKMGEEIKRDAEKAEKALERLGSVTNAQAKVISSANNTIVASTRARTKADEAAAKIKLEQTRADTALAKGIAGEGVQEAKGKAGVLVSDTIKQRELDIEDKKQSGKQLDALARFQLENQRNIHRRENAELKDHLAKRREIVRKGNAELSKDSRQVDAIMRRALGASPELQREIQEAIGGHVNQARRFAMRGTDVTQSQALNQQLSQRIGASNAAYLVGGGPRPKAFGGSGGGGMGIWGRLLGAGGGGVGGALVGGLASGLGIGLGGMALAGIGRGVMEDVDRATAYERQNVAARNLAGSQAKLNELLAAYATASGNAVDKVTSLSNVTRLMATGFAESAPEIEKFVRATRGASIALGKPQDYVIQETQLAISNISVKRLDQIGLGIQEVNDRIEQLRETNAGWTRETAFQSAVLSLMDEKYGKLTKTAEGQVTGVEKLRKAWSDLRLEMGKNAKGPVDQLSGGIAGFVNWLDVGTGQARNQYGADIASSRLDPNSAFDRYIASLNGLTVAQVNARNALMQGAGQGTWVDDSQPIAAPKAKGWSDEQKEVAASGRKAFEDFDQAFFKQRLDAVRQYESSRASLISKFNKQNLREEQDFQRGRARALRDYERSILDLMRDARDRETEMQEDLDDRISDLREGATEKLADIEKKYQKDREKAERDHRDRLLKAAGQLDAIAVLEERKRWKRENEERKEGHEEAVKEVKDNLQKQIDEAQEAHQERLEDARKADAKRLEDMALARERQLADENEDREIRKARAIEDHNDALEEMDRLHGENMRQMEREYAEQRELMVEEFALAMHDVGIYVKGVANLVMERQKAEKKFAEEMIGIYEKHLDFINNKADSFQFDPKTGSSVPEDYGNMLNVPPPITSSSISSTSRSSSLVVNAGAFQIYTTPGMEELVGQSVEDTLVKLMEAV